MLSVKEIKELQKSAKARRTSGLFTAEGKKMFREAPGGLIAQLCVSESVVNDPAMAALIREKLGEEGMKKRLTVLSDSRYESLSDTRTPHGILMVLHAGTWTVEDILTKPSPLILVLEDLQDPGNAGTILRTAEAAGVDGVFLTAAAVDIYNPKTIRSTMGSVYRVPHAVVDDMEALLAAFREKGIVTYAAALDGSVSYLEPDYTGGTAFFIGNESRGLSDRLQAACDCPIRIPMKGQIESLNAAMAAGILMYEAARKRA